MGGGNPGHGKPACTMAGFCTVRDVPAPLAPHVRQCGVCRLLRLISGGKNGVLHNTRRTQPQALPPSAAS